MSTGGRLKYTLVVRHPETAAPTALLAGESVPHWATDLVHKDDLEGAPAKAAASTASGSDEGVTPKAPAKKAAAKKAAPAKKAAAKKTTEAAPAADAAASA